ncbi:histidine phosphatase family protein [Paenibacillus sp. FSL H7-0756]|uniref:histidine phosphatase family protein n=1 Tax=Paenibacillus sp. FSL H3-0469 TaxID=2954506 RepID=UPI0030FDD67B
MSADFYLVRHAKKEIGIGDVLVSSEGLKQANMTAEHFKKVPFSRIVYSPLKRSMITAEIISKTTRKALTEDIRLRERVNWGDLSGQTFEEFVEMWNRCTREREFSPPVGDSARKAGERMTSCLLELADRHPHESFLIVTHGGLITDFLANEFNHEELARKYPNFIEEQSYLVPECSITKVRYCEEKFELIDFANVTHLNH